MASLLLGRELLPLRSFEPPQGPAASLASALKTMRLLLWGASPALLETNLKLSSQPGDQEAPQTASTMDD